MTIFLWDASHYDGTLTDAVLAAAHAEGIVGFTHKLGEGLGGADSTQGTALAAARSAGILAIGGYWFGHNADDPAAEARVCVDTADRYEPWWRDFPGWFWQADCETEGSIGKPSKTWIQKFCDELVTLTGRRVIVYASHGQYGDTLTGLKHPLWNANYPSARQAGFASLYPGDSFSGWAPYSGQTPVICQYSSSATIAGHTTCDANAFRGTVAQLLALIGGSMTGPTLTAADAVMIAHSDGVINNKAGFSYRDDSPDHDPAGTNQFMSWDVAMQSIAGQAHAGNVNASGALAQSKSNGAALTALEAKVAALPAAPIDITALAAALIPLIAAALKADMAAVIAAELAALQK